MTYFKWAPGAENEEIKTKETNRKKLSRTMSKGVRSCFRSLSVRLPRSRAFPMCDGVVLTSTPLCASFLRYSRRQWSRVRAFSMRDCHRVGLLSASKLSLRVSYSGDEDALGVFHLANCIEVSECIKGELCVPPCCSRTITPSLTYNCSAVKVNIKLHHIAVANTSMLSPRKKVEGAPTHRIEVLWKDRTLILQCKPSYPDATTRKLKI